MPSRKNMQYTREQLSTALASIRKGNRIRQAARSSGIPESTLRDKFRASYQQDKPGAPTVLTYDEENRIVTWVLDMAKMGFPVNTQNLTASVAHYVQGRQTKFKNGVPGEKWLKHFLKRHPNIARRVPSVLPKHRAAVSECQIRRWFTEIGGYIQAEGYGCVLKDPSRIFNMDETAVRTIPTKEVVLAGTGIRHLHVRVGNSDKESYTALFAANASGTLAPTLMLFPYKQRIPGEIFRNLPPNWAAGRTESGWMNRDTFYLYLRDVFHPWLLKKKIALPVIVFVDGHKSHVSHLTTELCQKANIILICLPPNSTQITQPLDVSFFRPLKSFWNQLLIEWRIDHGGEMLPRSEIAPLLQKAIDKMTNMCTTLVNGFRRSGLYPFDVDAVDYASLVTENNEKSTRQHESIQEASTGSTSHPGANDFLKQLETYLTPEQQQRFQAHDEKEGWSGPIEDTNLFNVWKKAKNGMETSITTSSTDCYLGDRDDDPPFQGFEDHDKESEDNPICVPKPRIACSPEEAKNPFSESFKKPTLKVPSRKMKKDHPPSVATSKAYKEYADGIEKRKLQEEEERRNKKEQKLHKKKEKEKDSLKKKFDRFIKQKK